MDKKLLRREIKEKRQLLSEDYIKEASENIEKVFLQSDFYKDCQKLFIYISTQSLQHNRKTIVP